MVDGRPTQGVAVGVEHRGDGRGPTMRVMPVDQCPAAAVGDRHRQAAHRGGHDRGPAGLRLHCHQAEGFRIARHRHQIRGAVDVNQLLARLRRQEGHRSGDSQFAGEPNQAVGGGKSAAGGAASDEHPHVGRQ